MVKEDIYNIINSRKIYAEKMSDPSDYRHIPIKNILPPSLEETITTDLLDLPKER